jgi:hypothetical protein
VRYCTVVFSESYRTSAFLEGMWLSGGVSTEVTLVGAVRMAVVSGYRLDSYSSQAAVGAARSGQKSVLYGIHKCVFWNEIKSARQARRNDFSPVEMPMSA